MRQATDGCHFRSTPGGHIPSLTVGAAVGGMIALS